jgi:transketolase
MRELLSRVITQAAVSDPSCLVLSGDHGYALFDEIRRERPGQFLNVGIMEQGMVGIAAGLAKVGMKPIVYGLSAFVPIRVLEQIKLDVCVMGLPVKFLGDGAGLVYSTLGLSHHCAEDLACLRPLPGMRIYSPCDEAELATCFAEMLAYDGPAYLRIGKSDRPKVHAHAPADCRPVATASGRSREVALVATGSMSSIATETARELGITAYSVPRIKPFLPEWVDELAAYGRLIVLEEHSRHGGLFSLLAEEMIEREKPPRLSSLSLADRFAHLCGSHQYALSEFGLSDPQLRARIRDLAGGAK